jgi:hypothetical protein
MGSSSGMATEPTPAVPNRLFLERRSTRRYQVSLPLAILPFSDRLMLHEQVGLPTGRTGDISTGGIYFTTYEPFTPGCELAFTLVLPPDLTRGGEVIIWAQGKVVRTEKRLEKGIERMGVAATIERFEIVKAIRGVSNCTGPGRSGLDPLLLSPNK